MRTVNPRRILQVQIKVITTIWTPYRIQLTLVLVVQTNLFVRYFLWKIHKCNRPEHRRKLKEVLKWVCIMQQVTGLKILCRCFLGKQHPRCMYFDHKLILQGSGQTNQNIILRFLIMEISFVLFCFKFIFYYINSYSFIGKFY